MKESAWFDDFKRYLSEEPVPGIDYSKNREAICRKLEQRSMQCGTRLRKKRLLLAAAVVVCLAAYPVYAITYSYFKELRGSGENISVKFQTATDEIKKMAEDKAVGEAYISENFREILQERYEALKPGEAEKIIVRSPDEHDAGFFTSVLLKPNYIYSFDVFADGLKRVKGFGSFRPVMELPGGFRFDKGVYYYKGDWYTAEDEMEALMAEAESNGRNYAVKPINYTDEIKSAAIYYKNGPDGDTTLSVHAEHSSYDTYILPEGTVVEELDHKGDIILAYRLPGENGDIAGKEYSLVKNDMFYMFRFSKDIGNDNAIEIIDAFLAMQ
ncbi:MAG TPA: hypothetical protein VIM13_07265 [Clostridia bacterium]